MKMKGFIPGRTDPHGGRTYVNGKYQVLVRKESPQWLVLSIRREDRKPIMDWRDIQWIKNQLLGENAEMVQLFPAESRLVDTSNQYYFYAPVEPSRFPMGFNSRMVTENIKVTQKGQGTSQQRKFAPHVKPRDLSEMEQEALLTLGKMITACEPCEGMGSIDINVCPACEGTGLKLAEKSK